MKTLFIFQIINLVIQSNFQMKPFVLNIFYLFILN